MPPTVFISYSHKDEAWKDRLVTHLAGLEQAGRLRIWNDRNIQAGQIWFREIEAAMEEARVAVLLISPEFLASKFIKTHEIPRLLERRVKEGVHIVPVIVKASLWEEDNLISSLQVRPQDGRALETVSGSRRNAELKKIAKEILDILRGEAQISGPAVGLRPLLQLPSLPTGSAGKSSTRFRAASMVGAVIALFLLAATFELANAKRASDHLANAARHMGDLGDVCLYREPLINKSEESILGVRLKKAQSAVAAARYSMQGVFWGKDELEVRAYQAEAEIWLLRERYEDALHSIEKGLAIDGSHLDLIVDRAEALRAQGKLKRAERELSVAYEGAGKKSAGRNAEEAVACAAVSLAMLREDLGLSPGSIEPLYHDAVRRHSTSFTTQWGYGRFLYKQRRFRESLEHLTKAYRLDRFDALNRLQLADAYFNIAESDREEVAIKYYREARLHYEEGFEYASQLSKHPIGTDIFHVNFGKTLFHLGYVEDAREELERSNLPDIPYHKDHAAWFGNSYLLLAQMYSCLQLWSSFEESLKQGSQYNPKLIEYRDQFRKDRQDNAAKWKPWGCQGSLTLRQKL